MKQTSVFLSGGFRSKWQDRVVEKLGENFIFYNPLAHNLSDSEEYTAWDLHYVRKCDIVFAYMEASNPSGYGLILEIGLAYGLGKTVILVDERSAVDEDFARYFKMAYHTADVTFDNFDKGVEYLSTFK